jgi:hypothetical protein
MTKAPPIYWYKTINIEEIEKTCSVEFTRTSLPPLEIVSWDKDSIYLRNRIGLLFTTPFDSFFDYLNWTRGFRRAYQNWTKGFQGDDNSPIIRTAVLNYPPPTPAEDIKDKIFLQDYGLVCWGLKHIIDCVLLRTRVIR